MHIRNASDASYDDEAAFNALESLKPFGSSSKYVPEYSTASNLT